MTFFHQIPLTPNALIESPVFSAATSLILNCLTMNKFLLLLLLFTSCACKKREEALSNLPACLQTLVADQQQSVGLETIRVQKIKGEKHYWLNTDARHLDGAEYIVNASCDTVCLICTECGPPECMKKYGAEEDWKIIWRK